MTVGILTLGPALALLVVLYSTGRLATLLPSNITTDNNQTETASVPFADSRLDNSAVYPSDTTALVASRRLGLAPLGIGAIEVVGDDLIAAGNGPLVAVKRSTFTKEGVRYLAPPDVEYAAATLGAVTDLQADGESRVWVSDYYGMVTLWSTSTAAAPLRAVHSVDGNMGSAWFDGHLMVHRPGSSANLTILALDDRRTRGAALVDGFCCQSLSVETTRVVREVGPPPFGRLNFGMAMWLGRASLANAEETGMVLAYLLDSRLHIYDRAAHLRMSVAGPLALPLVFRAKRPTDGTKRIDFAPTGETRFSYVSATANARAIYVLFAGEPLGGVGPARVFTGTDVHAYSWDGSLVAVYKLSEAVGKIAVSTDDQWLYGTSGTDVIEFRWDKRGASGQ